MRPGDTPGVPSGGWPLREPLDGTAGAELPQSPAAAWGEAGSGQLGPRTPPHPHPGVEAAGSSWKSLFALNPSVTDGIASFTDRGGAVAARRWH